MKLNFIFLLLAIILSFATAPYCATNKKPASTRPYAVPGQTVKTEYFSVTLPKGWVMPEQINKRPPALSAVFGDTKTHMAITVNVLKIPVQAKDLATQTMANMRKSGLQTGQLQLVNGLYRVPLTGKASGEAWFGCNGEICAATVILGDKINKNIANEFLKVFQPINKNLYPSSLK